MSTARLLHINIGSNLGDREANILAAANLFFEFIIDAGDYQASMRMSRMIESEPWGFSSPNSFLNVGVNIFTTLKPQRLLELAQMAEKCLSDISHRNPDGSYADRVVDIDLIWMQDTRLHTPRLILPHPRAHLRDFVLLPFHELNPSLNATIELKPASI